MSLEVYVVQIAMDSLNWLSHIHYNMMPAITYCGCIMNEF